MPEEIIVEKKPFHEAVVDFLGQVDDYATLRLVCKLLQVTKVPDQHAKAVADALWGAQKRIRSQEGMLVDIVLTGLKAEAAAYRLVEAFVEASNQLNGVVTTEESNVGDSGGLIVSGGE